MNERNFIPSTIKKIYLMAICGTGMGSLAGLLKEKGFEVCGSDTNVYPPMSDELQKQDISIFAPYSAENLKSAQPDLVIVGNAISKTNEEAAFLLESDIPYVSMPQALNHFFLSDKNVVVVSGTHGKTTTSAIMAHLLTELGADPSFMIGGVTKNFSKNFRIGQGSIFVIEGDEYDTAFFDKGPKFLHYNPKHVIMTSLEFDHADIYKDLDHITQSFIKLAKIIPNDGSLHYNDSYPALNDVLPHMSGELKRSYGQTSSQWQITDFKNTSQGSQFKISSPDTEDLIIDSPLSGIYNANNVASCLSVLQTLDFDLKKAVTALKSFKGIKRRQDILFQNDQFVVIDDFAHHPTAVKETITAIKERFLNHKLIAIFEPRSNTSRSQIFQDQYAQSFENADEVIIAPVNNPKKVPGGQILDVDQIILELNKAGKAAKSPKTTQDIVKQAIKPDSQPVVLLVMSNGGFDGLHQKLIQSLS